MKQLRFSNPTFHKGINLTVRKGVKWSLESGEIDVTNEQQSIISRARIVSTASISFYHIENHNLELEHDPKCRTYDGLLNELRRVYPDFIEGEIVSLVFFEILSDNRQMTFIEPVNEREYIHWFSKPNSDMNPDECDATEA